MLQPGETNSPSLSDDGTIVAFMTQASLVAGDNAGWNVHAIDRTTGALTSPTPDAILQDRPQLSGDGRFLLFRGGGGSLPQWTPGRSDVYIHQIATGTTSLAALSATGTQVNAGTDSGFHSISADGRFVAFSTMASNVTTTPVPAGSYQVYVHDREAAPAGGDIDPQDGIDDSLQPAGTAALSFVDESTDPDTVGRLVGANGLTGRITDAADPDEGVLVTVDAGVGGPAELQVCGMTVQVAAGSEVVFTCGSLIVAPVSGPPVEVVLDGGDIVVSVAAGSSVEIEDTPAGATLTNVSGVGVTVTVNGSTTSVLEGSGPYTYATDTTAPELEWHSWYNSWLVGPSSPSGFNASVQVECLDDSEVTATFVVRASTDEVVHEATPSVVPAGGCSALLRPPRTTPPSSSSGTAPTPSGSPGNDGSYPFVVRVEDAAGNAAQKSGTIFVGTPVTVTSPQPDDVVYGFSLDVEFTVSDPDWTRVFARVGGCAFGDIQALGLHTRGHHAEHRQLPPWLLRPRAQRRRPARALPALGSRGSRSRSGSTPMARRSRWISPTRRRPAGSRPHRWAPSPLATRAASTRWTASRPRASPCPR